MKMDIFQQIINNAFHLDLPQLKLEQLEGEHYTGIVIYGYGKIKYEDGRIFLIFTPNDLLQTNKEIHNLWFKSQRGNVLDHSHQFKLVAQTVDSTICTSDFVFLSDLSDYSLVTVPIKELHFTMNTHDNYLAKIILKGNYEFPFNTYVGNLENKNLCGFNFQAIDDISIKFTQYDNYMEILLFLNKSINTFKLNDIKSYCDKLVEAFCILQAKYIKPCCTQINIDEKSYFSINNIKRYGDNHFNNMPAPLCINIFGCKNSVIHFINLYINKFAHSWNDYFLFWYKTNEVCENYPEILSLVLTTSIEGIVSVFFNNHRTNPEVTQSDQEAAKKIVNQINNKIIQGKLLNIIPTSNINSITNQLNNILKNWGMNSQLAKKLANSWIKLRNDCAHANKTDLQDHASFKQHNKLQKLAFTVLYLLLFILIEYDDTCFDYSDDGYPLKQISDFKYCKVKGSTTTVGRDRISDAELPKAIIDYDSIF